MKNSWGINAVNEKRKLTRSEIHRDQKPRVWKAFHPLIFWAKCFPQGFTAAVSRWLSWSHTGCWSSKWSMWWSPSSDVPYSKQPSANSVTLLILSQCYSSCPSCPLLFVLQRHSCLSWKLTFSPLSSLSFFPPWLFSGYRAWWELWRRLIHLISSLPAYLLPRSEKAGRVSLLLLPSYTVEEKVVLSLHAHCRGEKVLRWSEYPLFFCWP